MKIVLQRVSEASVAVEGRVVSRIGKGLLILLGVEQGDGDDEIRWGAQKVAELRIFEDDEGKMNRSLEEVEGEALVVSQFTLLGDCRKGRRPSFVKAAHPEIAEPMYNHFVNLLRERGIRTATGRFAAHMAVSLVNDGPVTIILEK